MKNTIFALMAVFALSAATYAQIDPQRQAVYGRAARNGIVVHLVREYAVPYMERQRDRMLAAQEADRVAVERYNAARQREAEALRQLNEVRRSDPYGQQAQRSYQAFQEARSARQQADANRYAARQQNMWELPYPPRNDRSTITRGPSSGQGREPVDRGRSGGGNETRREPNNAASDYIDRVMKNNDRRID